jgi:hypothetical protein
MPRASLAGDRRKNEAAACFLSLSYLGMVKSRPKRTGSCTDFIDEIRLSFLGSVYQNAARRAAPKTSSEQARVRTLRVGSRYLFGTSTFKSTALAIA